jgi:hypothetical protein
MCWLIGFVVALQAAGGIPLDVTVGAKVEREVGNATGWFCDEPSFIDAKVVTREELNYWVVTGVRAGKTQCRVGTDTSRASFVFDVTVKPRPARRPVRR